MSGKRFFSATRILAGGFLLAIAAGTVLLSLPFASADGVRAPGSRDLYRVQGAPGRARTAARLSRAGMSIISDRKKRNRLPCSSFPFFSLFCPFLFRRNRVPAEPAYRKTFT